MKPEAEARAREHRIFADDLVGRKKWYVLSLVPLYNTIHVVLTASCEEAV